MLLNETFNDQDFSKFTRELDNVKYGIIIWNLESTTIKDGKY